MRTIKFRAWTGKEMIYFTLDDIDCGSVIGKKSAACVKQNCDETHHIQQFTGLLDKNGKEIYKGDFVEDDMKQKEAVVMEYGEWRVYGRSLWQESKSKRIEVIGNIYENPELLKS